jgi:hypothetical protein
MVGSVAVEKAAAAKAAVSFLGDARARWVTLRARWVTLELAG